MILSSVCSCWAFSCRAEVTQPATIVIISHVAEEFSCIIIAVSGAHCRAVTILICTEPSHWAAIPRPSVAVDLAGIIVAHGGAGAPAILAIISSSDCHWNASSWHFTSSRGVSSSSTHHFIRSTLYTSYWRANRGASGFHRHAVIHHWATVVEFTWADHVSFTACHWAATPTFSSIVSSHATFIWDAVAWHLTPFRIVSSMTIQFFFPVAFWPDYLRATVNQ